MALVSNELMFRLSREIADQRRQPAVRRTQYAIKATATGMWLTENMHWVDDVKDAKRFDTMTAANAFGFMEMGYRIDEFTVEAV